VGKLFMEFYDFMDFNDFVKFFVFTGLELVVGIYILRILNLWRCNK